jgi:hypothetical protein
MKLTTFWYLSAGQTYNISHLEHAEKVPLEKDHEQTHVANDTVKAVNSDEQAYNIAQEENNAESGPEIHVNYNAVHAEATEQAVNNENFDLVEPQIHDETSMISNTSFLMPLH